MLSGASGPEVLSLNHFDQGNTSALVVQFDDAMNPTLAQTLSEYTLTAPKSAQGPFYSTKSGVNLPLSSASYNSATHSVTLTSSSRLSRGTFYRLTINGQPGVGLTGADGQTLDGDYDQTPGGNYANQIGWGSTLKFADAGGDQVTLKLTGGGQEQVTRTLGGDVEVLAILGAVPYTTTLSGTVHRGHHSKGQVVIPSLLGASEVIDTLAGPSFQVPQAPLVATANFPYTLQLTPVTIPSAPALQSMSVAQADGYWLMIGGRTNGLHNFNSISPTNPDGGFPRVYQNRDIFVVNPTTGQTSDVPWSKTGVSLFTADSLSSTNQESYVSGGKLYVVGGYGVNTATNQFVTFDTLTSIDVSAMIHAVVTGGDVASTLRQIQNPRLAVTGGEMNTINGRTYLVFGQDFEGLYTGSGSNISQVYNDTVASFQIIDKPSSLGISHYQAQYDPANFHRRDYSLAPITYGNGTFGLAALGGVFTPAGNGYTNPIYIGSGGTATVDFSYQQFFSQYKSPTISLFNARDRSTQVIHLGGIGLEDYNPATGQFTNDPGLPFVSDISTLIRQASGATQEYVLPARLPYLLGAEAAFFAAPGVPTSSNGVVQLGQIKGPTVLGTFFGGILAQIPNFGNSTASALAYQVTLIPKPSV